MPSKQDPDNFQTDMKVVDLDAPPDEDAEPLEKLIYALTALATNPKLTNEAVLEPDNLDEDLRLALFLYRSVLLNACNQKRPLPFSNTDEALNHAFRAGWTARTITGIENGRKGGGI